jgi:hypothetical protein
LTALKGGGAIFSLVFCPERLDFPSDRFSSEISNLKFARLTGDEVERVARIAGTGQTVL